MRDIDTYTYPRWFKLFVAVMSVLYILACYGIVRVNEMRYLSQFNMPCRWLIESEQIGRK